MAYLDSLDDENDDEASPYDSISTRPPIGPVTPTPSASAADPMIKQFLMQKNASSMPTGDVSNDPLMQQYLKDKSSLDDLRQAKMHADTQSNLAQAFSQLAQGTNAPKDTGVFNKIASQNQEMISEKDKDIARQQKVMEAIAGRQARAADAEAKRKIADEIRNQTQSNREIARQDRKEREAKINTDIRLLPAEDQEVVKDLAKKSASKIAIANQIDAVMSKWDSLSDDQKLGQGRQLLKVLNSTEGADAIGAEEAKRLGTKLEFAMGNFTNSNPTQFGRDLKGFAEQARITSQGLKSAIKANESEIGRRYARVGIQKDPGVSAHQESGSQKIVVSNGQETLEIDPSDLADAEKDGYKRM